jgi:DNA-binding beta-propeller fold protein YncE
MIRIRDVRVDYAHARQDVDSQPVKELAIMVRLSLADSHKCQRCGLVTAADLLKLGIRLLALAAIVFVWSATGWAAGPIASHFESDAQEAGVAGVSTPAQPDGRRLYVAVPGIRDYLEFGGHGLLIFDIDHGHRFVKRVKTAGLGLNGVPLNVKGICASVATKRVYISTIKQLMSLDLVSETLLWERSFQEGCDRMSMTPDGEKIYLPSLEGPLWNVVSGDDGHVMARITPDSGSHNTVVGLDGKAAYLAGLKSSDLTVVDTGSQRVVRTVGPFSASIRPFTVNGRQTLCFVNVNGLLGFEVGDIATGAKLARVEVSGFSMGPTKRHGCPSHGIGLTPDESEIWIADAFNSRLHIFDARTMPPRQLAEIKVREQPGWITFSIDGQYAYPSTGDVIETKSRKIVAQLTDETGRQVHSEKMVEVDFGGGVPVRAGDQFGLGRVGVGAAK